MTKAQINEQLFIKALIEKLKLKKDQINEIVDLARKHYFDPTDSIAQVWCFDDFSHLTHLDLDEEEQIKALAYLEDTESCESDSQYDHMEYYFNYILS